MEVKKGYVAVINPVFKKDSVIEMSEDTKREMMLDQLQKLEKLEISHVPLVIEGTLTLGHSMFSKPLEVGDFIHVSPDRLMGYDRYVDGDICYIFVREGDIIFKY